MGKQVDSEVDPAKDKIQMQAQDVMTTDVITVDPEADVATVAKLLLDHRISAAPVVARDGKVLGVVSEGDLMRRAGSNRGQSWWLSLMADRTAEFIHIHGTRARDIMTPDVVYIAEEATLDEAAHTLEVNHIKRVPVIKDGHLVGLVSRADILRGLATFDGGKDVHPTMEDREIRARILESIRRETDASMQSASVIVVNGKVYLWGMVENEQDRDAVRIAAERVGGGE
jgi:CBS domain-containing protein